MHLSGQDVTLAAPECSLWPGFLLTPHAPPSTSLLRLKATVQVTNPQIFTSARVVLSPLDVPTLCKPYGQIELSFRLTLAPSAPLSGVAVRSHSPVFSLVASSTSTFGRCSTAAHLAPTRSEPASSSLGQCRSLSGFLPPPPPTGPLRFSLGAGGRGGSKTQDQSVTLEGPLRRGVVILESWPGRAPATVRRALRATPARCPHGGHHCWPGSPALALAPTPGRWACLPAV